MNRWKAIAAGKDPGVLSLCCNWVLPLSFVFSSMLNLCFFYLGLAYQDNAVRKYGYILGCVLFALACGWLLLLTLRSSRLGRKRLIGLSAVLVYFGCAFAFGVARGGLQGTMADYLKTFVFFVLPSFFAGIIAAVKGREASFFAVLEQVSFLALPAAVIYANCALFDCNPFTKGTSLGMLNYMSFAYTLMPLLLALLVRFSNEEPLGLDFAKKQFRHPQRVRAAMIAVYWVAIIASGTRGAYVCVIVFCTLLVVSAMVMKKRVSRTLVISLVMAGVLLFNMFVYAPPGMQGVQRMTAFLDNLKAGQLSTSDSEDSAISEQIDELLQAETEPQREPSRTQEDDAPEAQAPATEDTTAQLPSEPEAVQSPEEEEIDLETIEINDRGTMYKLALGEFRKSPLFGMGPGGYGEKYGSYPHNVILEMLCETGLVGTVIILSMLAVAIVRIVRAGLKNENIWYLFLFFFVYAVQANISGSLWQCYALLCAIGYGFALPPAEK